jgi:hypothetical protein
MLRTMQRPKTSPLTAPVKGATEAKMYPVRTEITKVHEGYLLDEQRRRYEASGRIKKTPLAQISAELLEAALQQLHDKNMAA